MLSLLVLLLVLLAAACGDTREQEGSSQDPGGAAGGGAESPRQLVVASPQEPNTLLPHFDLLSATHEVLHLAFDCLYAINEQGEYVPRLAREVPTLENGLISEDGRTYTIPLREGVTWQDGTPFTSADVKFTWQVIMNDDLPIPSRVGWSEVKAVETPDDHTVVFHFDKPNVAFLETLATGSCFMLPRHALEGTDLVASEHNRKPLGNGPYRVEEWVAGSHIRLVRNPNYWQEGLPHFDEIVYRIIPGTEGMRAALERGDVHVQLFPSVADQQFVRGLSNYRLAPVPGYSWWFFWLNNEHPALSDVRVRRALSHAIDREAIADSVFGGEVEPMWAALPPNHWAHNPDVTRYPYDPEAAAALLEEAGWTLGPDGVRVKDGQPLRLEILNIAGEQERLQVVQIVQNDWRRIGVDATIRQIDAASFPPTMAEGTWDVAYGRFGEQHEPTFNLWLGTNWQRYGNEEALDLLRQALTTVDREARRDLILRFQEIVAEEQPVLFLVPRVAYSAYHVNLQGFAPSLTASLWNAAEWQWR